MAIAAERPPMSTEERDALVVNNMRLVPHVVNRIILPTADVHALRAIGGTNELIADGLLLLVKLASSYNPNYISPRTGQAVKFSTWAVFNLRRHFWDRLTRTRRRECREHQATMMDDGRTILDDIACPDAGAHEQAEANERRELAHRLVRSLPPKERRVIRERFWKDRRLHQVAEQLDLSKERVRQIQLAAIDAMAAAVN